MDMYKYCPTCKTGLVPTKIDGDMVKKCSSCGFTFWNNPKPVVSVLLHENNKVLLLQRSNEPFKDFWVLSGGFIKSSEIAEVAVRREAKEEIGTEIDIENIIGTYLIENDPRGIHLDIIFSGTANRDITLNSESSNWQYFSVENLPEKIAYKHRQAIIDWSKR